MFGSFFDTTAIDDFADQVVRSLVQALPPKVAAEGSGRTAQRLEQAQRNIRRHAGEFAKKARPNVYQKAKLGLCLQDKLETAGYAKDFSKPFARDVVSAVALAAGQQA